MKNFFYAPAKATTEAPAILSYLQSLGNVRFAEALPKVNSDYLRRLKLSESRSDVTTAACILTAPTENSILDGTKIAVGRGITDIGEEALDRQIPTYICRRHGQGWAFHRVINFDRSSATGNWKLDFSRAIIEPAQTADLIFQ